MGIINWVYTVTNSVTAALLQGVNIWASSDIGGQIVLDSDVTNASGQVSLQLEDNSEVYIWHSLAGYTADANPNNQTVTAFGGGSGTMTAIVSPVPDAVVLSTTCLDLISDALAECGILAQGETATAEDSDFAHKRLNQMIESWRIQRRLIYKIDVARHTLTADATSHTIGPSGDFVTERPTRIVRANIVVTGFTPELHNPLNLVERAEEWAELTAPLLPGQIPSHLYCDYGWPDATLYLFPYPTQAYDLELFTWKQFDRFKTLTDAVSFPPGYYDALMYSLAERLCTPFGVPLTTKAQVSADAARARYVVSSHNTKAPIINLIDAGIPNTESL